MTRSTIWRRAAAVLAVGALAVVGGAGAAQAAPTIDDPTATGSITVHKRVNPTENLTEGDGLENPSAPGDPLTGIAFDVQKISTVNLTTTGGWELARDYAANPSLIPSGDLDDATRETTAGTNATATFSPLAIGAYLVTEQLTPAQIASGLTAAAPFVVTVPMTHPTDLDRWIYDVNVYPKNLQSTVTKTVNDETTYQVGDTIDWTISTPVPAQGPTTRFAFKDELVDHLIIPESPADNVVVTLDGTELDAADYELEYDAAGDNILWVRLLEPGLLKLNDVAGTTAEVAVTLTTEVVSLPTNGVIENSAVLFPNESFPLDGTGVPTNQVESRFGAINITKQDADAPGTRLAGAEFKVFRSLDDANAYAAGEDEFAGTAAEYAALPLRALQNGTGDLTDTFVTGADGTVSITGLRASNWQDGELLDPDTDPYQNYWLLETKAPSGYELATAPIGEITVFYDETTPTVLPYGEVTVPNVAKPELPLTGGQIATGVFGLLGALVLTGGVLLVIRARRQDAGA